MAFEQLVAEAAVKKEKESKKKDKKKEHEQHHHHHHTAAEGVAADAPNVPKPKEKSSGPEPWTHTSG
jgi:hypothetical protein